jgi:N-acyl-D-aspartate/D-glutamate deacylase
MNDLLIKGAQLADGTGAPLAQKDVAVKDGLIAAVGEDAGSAREVVEADGLVLCPGVVDVHTHYDAQLTWEAQATPSPALGVSTIVAGNCGFGIAPCPPSAREQMARNLAEVEGMSLKALSTGIKWDFETFPEYLDMLRRQGSFPNVGVFIGHSAVRTAVMGEEASARAATDDEVATMRDLVSGAMDAGAVGFATSTSINHSGAGGVPMPSRLADESEMHTLVSVLGEKGRGVFQITVGPDTTVPYLEGLSAETGRPVFMTAALHNATFPDRAIGMLHESATAQSRGHGVWAQVSCQPLSMDFGMEAAFPLQSLDVWDRVANASPEEFLSAIRDPAFRDKFRAELAAPQRGKLFYGDWETVEVAMATNAENRPLEGRSIREIAAERDADPVDVFFDLAGSEQLHTVFNAKLLNADEDAVEELLRHDAGLVSLSDAGAHLKYLCDAGYGLHLLGYWVRDKKTFELADAVRRVTSLPAQLYGIEGRGVITPGAHADMLLFDPATVGRGPVKRMNDLPGGESRLIREGEGVHGVWINGVHVHDGKSYSDVPAPGHVLDHFAA